MPNTTELAIMAALAVRPLYGLALIERVATITRRRVQLSLGGVYSTLHRMEAKHLIEGFWGDESESRSGARRRYYRLTDAGKQSVTETRQMLADALKKK